MKKKLWLLIILATGMIIIFGIFMPKFLLNKKIAFLRESVEVKIKASDLYNRLEIESAKDLLIQSFAEEPDFSNSSLRSIAFSEKETTTTADRIIKTDRNYYHAATKNFLVLQVSFNTGNPPPTGTSTNSDYTWDWIFFRESENSSWKIIDKGI